MTTSDATTSAEHSTNAVLNDGTPVHIRAIHPEDVELERRFIESLSPASRRFRFLESIVEPSAELLRQMTVIDPATDASFVALLGTGTGTDAEAIEIGVARFVPPSRSVRWQTDPRHGRADTVPQCLRRLPHLRSSDRVRVRAPRRLGPRLAPMRRGRVASRRDGSLGVSPPCRRPC